MITKKQLAVMAAVLMLTLIGQSQEKSRLSKKSGLWLEKDAALVITQEERDVFLQLETESERDRFITEFWRQRDPNLETRENEFRLEHYRRIALADDKFGRTKGEEGWRTDRGKFYVLLGKPTRVDSFSGEGIHPLEIWMYNVRYFGLPSQFRILFFQPKGEGEYRLYRPLADGPSALVSEAAAGPQTSQDNSALQGLGLSLEDIRAWRVLKEQLGPPAAETSLSFIPSLKGPGIREESQTLLEDILVFPAENVDKSYPAQFISGQAGQAVNTSLHATGCDSLVRAILDSSGLFYIHYALSPKSFSLVLSRGNHVTNVKTSLLLTDSEGKTAYQGVRNTGIELTGDELTRLSDARLQLFDAFAAIPGRYTLNLIMENQAGKEFFSLEKTITVPQSGYPWMSSPILARKVEKNIPGSDSRLAFLAGSHHIFPSLDHIFSPDDQLYAFIQLRGLDKAALDSSILEIDIIREDSKNKMLGIQKNLNEYEDIEGIVEKLDLAEFPKGVYRLNARLVDGSGAELLAKQETFSIAMNAHKKIWALSLNVPSPSDPRLAFMLGMQYLNRNDRDMAYQYLSQAQKGDKGSFDYALALARVLSTREEWPTMIEVLAPFSRLGRRSFELCVFLGRAFQQTGQYEQAVTQYLRAISYRGYVTSVLNDLGGCYVELGNTERAAWAWEKSLEMRPDQQELKRKLDNLKK